jgi:Tol biopolymer transport system component
VSAGVGIVEPASGKVSTLMTFLGDTEGLSMLNWSPDKKKVAFVALNHAQYPKMTRIFVLTLEGNTLVKKEKYDAPVFAMAAADWAINPVEFVDNKTIRFTTITSEAEEGPEQKIILE